MEVYPDEESVNGMKIGQVLNMPQGEYVQNNVRDGSIYLNSERAWATVIYEYGDDDSDIDNETVVPEINTIRVIPNAYVTKELLSDLLDILTNLMYTFHLDRIKLLWGSAGRKVFNVMISRGFYPAYRSSVSKQESVYDFIDGKIDRIKKPSYWRKDSPIYLAVLSEKSPDNYINNILKRLYYSKSKRPMTRMSTFVNSGFQMASLPKTRNGIVRTENHLLISVARYGEGMSRGAYSSDYGVAKDVGQFCGTFYYWEPDSDIYLDFKHSDNLLFAENKVDAFLQMRSRVAGDEASFHEVLDDTVDVLYPKNMASEDLTEDILNVYLGKNNLLGIDQEYRDKNGKYYEQMYALEDPLDQTICKMARELRYDGIFLSRMVGSRRVVSEVLDTRSREESFKNLVFNIR